jgi:N-acetylglucosamine-6-phosphate deacetylase
VFDLVGPGRIALVTDAMAAAGMPDGDYPLGSMPVAVRAGVARLRTPDGIGAIAGGTAHMIDLVRRAVQRAGVDLGAAVTAASATPAALLGLAHEVGDLRPGLRADVLVTDPDLDPVAVLAAGAWVPRPTLVHA